MEKHNPSSFTVDSSSPAHRSSFAVHDLTPYINWIYFFHAWGFQPRYLADHFPGRRTEQGFRSDATL